MFVCSGQSNMEAPLGYVFDGRAEAGRLAAAWPNWRVFQVVADLRPTPQDTFRLNYTELYCTPTTQGPVGPTQTPPNG